MGADNLSDIDRDLKRDAWFFREGDIITIREGRRITGRETVGKVFHGWDTTRARSTS